MRFLRPPSSQPECPSTIAASGCASDGFATDLRFAGKAGIVCLFRIRGSRRAGILRFLLFLVCIWRWLTPLRFGWRSPRLSRLLATSSTLAKTAPSRSLPFTGSRATYTIFLSSWTLSCWNSTNRRSDGLNMITNPELYNYLDIMSESPFHYQVQAGLRKYLEASLGKLHANTKDPAIRNQIRLVKEQGTARIKVDRNFLRKPISRLVQSVFYLLWLARSRRANLAYM